MARLNKWERQHLKNLSILDKRIEQIYEAAVKEATRLGLSITDFSPDRLFSFDDYPITRKRIEKLLSGLKSDLSAAIVNGINSAWTLSNNKNNELSRQVFGDNVGKLSQVQYRRYFSTNDNAREAFIARKTHGLNLSDRVWNYTNQFKEEIELGLDVGLRNGVSAVEMTQELRQYLKYPDKLFRRVKDEHGILQLSKRAAAFHPGQGVYRSSFKNARRLAATETNIAYRTADYERWQDLDFVVGIEIKLSNNHTLNGVAFSDICDELKGRYPKTFKFTGWHPHCRCHAETVLKTEKEMAEDTQRILDGKPLDEKSVNRVDNVPNNFREWITKNKDRIEQAKSTPYFIQDNQSVVNGILQPKAEKSIPEIKFKESDMQLLSDIENRQSSYIGYAKHSARELQGIAKKYNFIEEAQQLNDIIKDKSISIDITDDKLKEIIAKLKPKSTKSSSTLSVPKTSVATVTNTVEEKATWYQTGKEADAAFRSKTGNLWRQLSEKEKNAIYAYTGDDFALINRILRKEPLTGWKEPEIAHARAYIPQIKGVIKKATVDKPLWVQRVESINGLQRFGVDPDKVTDTQIRALVGKKGKEKSFLSTCVVKNGVKGMDGDFDIIYDIKIPKGAKAVYTEPFSEYGAGAGRSWDGHSLQKSIGSEAELLLQSGYEYKISKVTKETDGFWHIELEVII